MKNIQIFEDFGGADDNWTIVKNTGKYTEWHGEELPDIANKIADEMGAMKYGGWVAAYYRGADPEKATDWVFVADDGGFYKVDAEYMIWYDSEKDFEHSDTKGRGKAVWSDKYLVKALTAILNDKDPGRDPDYQT